MAAVVSKRSPKPKSSTSFTNLPGSAARGRTSAPGAARPADAGQITARYAGILARAGSDASWVKHPGRPAADASDPPVRGEVLALASASQAIVSSLQRQAEVDGLRLEIRSASPRGGGSAPAHDLDLTLSKGGVAICAWRLRQVARLYRVGIVIDDLGQEMQPVRALLAIPYPLTFSVLPHLPESRETAAAANRAGREVMLHLPMEPLAESKMSPGEGALRVGMSASEVDRLVEGDLASVPYAAGVNNHMGSRATSDPALMANVMKELASRRLYFIDSRTAASTVALGAAREAGIPAFYRSIFLDDTETLDYTLGQLRRLRALVEQQGVAVAIGHPHPSTIRALEKFLPELERDDIELVPPSRLVRLPEAARLSPPRSAGATNGN
ncbi:MAG TPA: divergent polysaccharide deacetylase family protein [Terriglobia bacterium]|nr:divergent polysaccharide deacetylase family protein [Terriglobia bacterium]